MAEKWGFISTAEKRIKRTRRQKCVRKVLPGILLTSAGNVETQPVPTCTPKLKISATQIWARHPKHSYFKWSWPSNLLIGLFAFSRLLFKWGELVAFSKREKLFFLWVHLRCKLILYGCLYIKNLSPYAYINKIPFFFFKA